MTKKILLALASVFVFISFIRAEDVIFRFNGVNGSAPEGELIADSNGNLYGTTSGGGTKARLKYGVVFKLSPASGGGWLETVLYTFHGSDGSQPTDRLLMDKNGNLYGHTASGGTSYNGVVFKLSPGSDGVWKETVLHSFANAPDGAYPSGTLAMDSGGNLYGTTILGGPFFGQGIVYELSPQSDGSWKETIIYSFGTKKYDGDGPAGGVTFDNHGNLFGTTGLGGTTATGTVYELSQAKGQWALTILYNFLGSTDGSYPASEVTFDAAGNLYSSASQGGSGAGGTIFELSPGSGGQWSYSVLYAFGGKPNEGTYPSGVVFDNAGNLYGTNLYGGGGCNSFPPSNELPSTGCGVIFKLTSQGQGPWSATVLHSLQSAFDGSQSSVGLLFSSAANRLYGVTRYGGSLYGYGTVFEVQP